MKKIGIAMAVVLLTLSACAARPNSTEDNPTANPAEAQTAAARTENSAVVEDTQGEPREETSQEKDDNGAENTMKLLIGEKEVPVTWEDNASVEALRALCPLTIRMSMYGGFEQVGPIGQSIVSDDVQTNTNYGDIVLYSGNQIVIFYGSNSWAYTRLGHVNLSQKEMSDLLSNGDTAITLK